MAHLFPAKPRLKSSPAFRAFFRVLKELSDDYCAWISLGEKADNNPVVFLVWRERHAFLIQVADTSQKLAEATLHGDFFTPQQALLPDEFGKPESQRLEALFARARQTLGPLQGEIPVKRMIIFPNVDADTIDQIALLRSGDTDTSYCGLSQLSHAQFRARLESSAIESLPEPTLLHLRSAFTPESLIPPSFTAKAPATRNTHAQLPPSFLDFDQEWCVKNDIDLPPEQDQIVQESINSTRLITGVAGSGKSLVLLYRALLTARLHPHARVLVLTHNKPLRYELERRSRHLAHLPENISCHTFFQWAQKFVSIGKVWWPSQIERFLTQQKSAYPALRDCSTTWLADEIGWIKDNRLMTRLDYINANRKGRGTPLRGKWHAELWDLFKQYQQELEKQQATDWHNIALRFHHSACIERSLPFPHYDAVFIDEAQFFAKTWFEIVKAALKQGGHLFLAADPTQGFLRRKQTWISAGIEVRGRTTRLTQPYRTTQSILRFAREFYQRRSMDDELETELNIPDEAMIATIREHGETPCEIFVANAQEEIARTVNEVNSLRKKGLHAGQLLILQANGKLLKPLQHALAKKLGEDQWHDAKQGIAPAAAFCTVTTLQAATGMEAAVVILLGIDHLLEKEQDPRLSPEEKAELRRDHTRLLYMGFTRAGQRLILIRNATSQQTPAPPHAR
jgi:superfamily I DNA/RNA helicase